MTMDIKLTTYMVNNGLFQLEIVRDSFVKNQICTRLSWISKAKGLNILRAPSKYPVSYTTYMDLTFTPFSPAALPLPQFQPSPPLSQLPATVLFLLPLWPNPIHWLHRPTLFLEYTKCFLPHCPCVQFLLLQSVWHIVAA